MKKSILCRTAKFFSMLAIMVGASVPVWAQGENAASAGMSPVSIVVSVLLVIGLIILLAAKGAHRVSHK
jgi:hypothetical protein